MKKKGRSRLACERVNEFVVGFPIAPHMLDCILMIQVGLVESCFEAIEWSCRDCNVFINMDSREGKEGGLCA